MSLPWCYPNPKLERKTSSRQHRSDSQGEEAATAPCPSTPWTGPMPLAAGNFGDHLCLLGSLKKRKKEAETQAGSKEPNQGECGSRMSCVL